jgi:hypothetical protein
MEGRRTPFLLNRGNGGASGEEALPAGVLELAEQSDPLKEADR